MKYLNWMFELQRENKLFVKIGSSAVNIKTGTNLFPIGGFYDFI